jgi:subtilisin
MGSLVLFGKAFYMSVSFAKYTLAATMAFAAWFPSSVSFGQTKIELIPPSQVLSTQGLNPAEKNRVTELLARKAQEQGGVQLLVKLDTTLIPENQLSAAAAREQAERLLALEDRVLARAFGNEPPPRKEVRFGFIPYMSVYVNADQLRRLIADPEVLSARETVTFQTAQQNLSQDADPSHESHLSIIHANELSEKFPGATGEGYHIAILDSGVDKNHPMLAGKVASEACYSCSGGDCIPTMELSVCDGKTESTDPGSGMPCQVSGCEHGTMVASIAAGKNMTPRLRGVAPGASLISIKVVHQTNLYCGGLPEPCVGIKDLDLLAGFKRVYDLRKQFKISAVNISLGRHPTADVCGHPAVAGVYRDIFILLRGEGIAPIVAGGDGFPIGNDGKLSIPACADAAMPVSATTQNKDQFSWTSHDDGRLVAVAPGSYVYGAVPGNRYSYGTGTSFAAPQISGAMALFQQAKPETSVDIRRGALSCSSKEVVREREKYYPAALFYRSRLDLLAAYNWIQRIPNARTWNFDKVPEFFDWNPFRGKWILNNGHMALDPPVQGWVGTYTRLDECNLQSVPSSITVRMKRTSAPENKINFNGIVLQTNINYSDNKTVSGYWFAYTNSGTAAVYRWDNYSFNEKPDPAGLELCRTNSANVNPNDFNTLKAEKSGGGLKFYLNGKMVCGIPAYNLLGRTMIAGYMGIASGQDNLEIDSARIETPSKFGQNHEPSILEPVPGSGPYQRFSNPATAFPN